MVAILTPPGFVRADSDSEKTVRTIIVRYRDNQAFVEMSVPAGKNIQAFLKEIQADPRVLYAEPNYIYQAATITPNDINFSDQWYLKRIKAPEGWAIQNQSPNVIIAVIDSGVDITHPDLKSSLWTNNQEEPGNKQDDDNNGLVDDYYGWDFVNNVPDPSPKFKPGFTEAGILHGTIIAGLIGASGNNVEGIAGLTWKTKIMSLKALDDAGNGEVTRVVKAIDYAVTHGANIINLSFVGYAHSQAMQEAIERAVAAGVLVVAPAGNEQSAGQGVNLNSKPIYPACYKNSQNQSLVIGVAATDGIDQKASFSGYGKNCVALSAPGVSFFSTAVYAPQQSWQGRFFDTHYSGYWSGTSVAVPLVSGTLALIQAANPTLTPAQSLRMLLDGTDNIDALNPGFEGQLGQGRLNSVASLARAVAPLQTQSARLVLAPAAGAEPFVQVAELDGQEIFHFLAYDRNFKGGVNVTTADVLGDGRPEIITAPATGLESDIKIFDHEGRFIRHFLAYEPTFRGGVNLATVDLNQDGKYEIITAPASGYRAEIKIFTAEGKLLRSFLGYPKTFTGGAVLAVGNVMGSSEPEIVLGTGKGGVPQVKIFSLTGKLLHDFVVGNRNAATGLNISLLDIDQNSRRQEAELVITRQSQSTEGLITSFRGVVRRRFQVYNASFPGAVKTVTADVSKDGVKEIISFVGAGGAPHVKFFSHLGEFQRSFYAYPLDFDGGVNVAVLFTSP